MNSQPTFLFLTNVNLMNMSYYQKHANHIILYRTTLEKTSDVTSIREI